MVWRCNVQHVRGLGKSRFSGFPCWPQAWERIDRTDAFPADRKSKGSVESRDVLEF